MDAPTSRRIHGRHPLLPAGGAAADADGIPEDVARSWLARAEALAERYGLPAPVLRWRAGHAAIGQPCPPDLRDLAADLLDQATGAEPERELHPRPDPALRAWLDAARAAQIPAFFDEDTLTVGLGRPGRRMERAALPPIDESSTSGLRIDVPGSAPVVLVTGTNGKTTTAVLLAAIGAAAGKVTGLATSTGVRVGGELVEAGDWSGPGAARIVGNDGRVELAVLETARGGLLRRGLLADPVDVAVLTNVRADHLGDWGIDDLRGLARVKVIVAEAVRTGGAVVSNGADPVLDEVLREVVRPDVRWVRFTPPTDGVVRWPGGELPAAAIPLALGGAARYNVENALAAALAAHALGLPDAAIAAGLAAVRPSAADNPGRTNVLALRGATLLVDYCHNPDGLRRLAELVDGLRPRRRWMVLGQAGDRPDALVLELAAEAAAIGAERYVLKPLPGYARGRAPSEVVAVLRRGLLAAGVGPERIEEVGSEAAAVARIADLVGPGDLGLVLVHEDLDGALAALASRGAV